MVTREVSSFSTSRLETEAEHADEAGDLICFGIHKNKLGCALLDTELGLLKVLAQDYILTSSADRSPTAFTNPEAEYASEINMIVESLLLEVSPSMCIISTEFSEESYNYINDVCERLTCNVNLRSTEDYRDLKQLQVIRSRNTEGNIILEHINQNAKSTCSATVESVCCLLKTHSSHLEVENFPLNAQYMVKGRIINTSTSSNCFQIDLLELKDRLFIDEDTLRSLHIFPPAERTGQDKMVQNGALSLLELLNRTYSEAGLKLLKSWLTSPLSNISLLRQRYSILRTLMRPENALVFDNLTSVLSKCPCIFNTLNQLQMGKSTVSTWTTAINFLTRSTEIYYLTQTFQYAENEAHSLQNICKDIDVSILQNLCREITRIIDIDLSKETKNIKIHDAVDYRLDECREIYNQLEDLLSAVAQEVHQIVSSLLAEEGITSYIIEESHFNAVYIPQLGYLVTVDKSLEQLVLTSSYFEWEEVFRTPTNIYLKNARTTELDEQFGDIYGQITDLEIEILHSLQLKILEHQNMLYSYSKALTELEVYVSFALVSIEQNYIEPELSDQECILDIEQGRHPLYDTFLPAYIPNSLSLIGGNFASEKERNKIPIDAHRLCIVTGANASGKSAFLTQNALIVYLAHIGCFVPARSAKIGIVDKILCRLQNFESISKGLSSFGSDCQQMAKCMSLMSEKSLLLIDEFGKGTDIVDGPALFGSIINVLAQNRSCPRVLACTHFHELFKNHILGTNLPHVKFCATEVLLSEVSGHQNETALPDLDIENRGITFLYKVKEGITTESFGIFCAKLCGINNDIITRAHQLHGLINKGYNMVDYCGQPNAKELYKFDKNQNIVKRFLSWDLDLDATLTDKELTTKLNAVLEM